MSLPFDMTDARQHAYESDQRSQVVKARLEKIEQDMHGHIQRTSGIWRDVRSLKWLIRLMIPLIIALAGLAPWVTRRVVVDVMTDVGVVKLQPTWQDR